MPIEPAFFDSSDLRIRFDNPNLFFDIGLVTEGSMAEPIQIKLELKKAEADYIADGTTIHTNMAKPENATLITGAPYTPVQLKDLLDAYAAKVQAGKDLVQAQKTNTTQKKEKKALIDEALTRSARHFESKVGITASQVEGLGFDLKSAGAPVAIVAPEELSATFGDASGSISLHWDPVRGAASYVAQYRVANAGGAWLSANPVTASSMQLAGLTPGELYELRVCAIFPGQQNPGPACDTIEHRAA